MRQWTASRPSHVTPTDTEIAAVRELHARVGLRRAQEILGLGRHTIERVRGGLSVHRATMIAVRVALGMEVARPEATS
jgi:hypothetical protein